MAAREKWSATFDVRDGLCLVSFSRVFGGNPLEDAHTTFFDVCDVEKTAPKRCACLGACVCSCLFFNFQVQKAVEEREKDIVRFMTRNLEDDDSLEEPEKPRKVHIQ